MPGISGWAVAGFCLALISVSACESAPKGPVTPSPGPGGTPQSPFVVIPAVNPIYIGYGSKVTPESPPQSGFSWTVTVQATGERRGTLQSVDVRLVDRATGQLLGTEFYPGPFLNVRDPRRPNQVIDPLREVGQQTFDRQSLLGFVGNAATLEIEAHITDVEGMSWTATASVACELFPRPVLRSPVNVTVRQNDPKSGCTFDTVHGYGLLLEVAWDPPPGNHVVDDYTVAVADGAGTEILWPFYAHTRNTSYRLVRCDLHVPPGAEHNARAAVTATNNAYRQLTGFSSGRFDFQSCHEAGTPACR